MLLEERREKVSKFVQKYGREISVALRDGRDDDKVYVVLGHSCDGRMHVECKTESDILKMDTRMMGVQFCLDQIRALSQEAHRTDMVVAGIRFEDGDVFTVITRVRPV